MVGCKKNADYYFAACALFVVFSWKERVFGLSKSGKLMHYYETEAALRKHETTDEKNYLGTVDLKDNAYIFYVDFLDEFRHCFEGGALSLSHSLDLTSLSFILFLMH